MGQPSPGAGRVHPDDEPVEEPPARGHEAWADEVIE